MSANITEIQVDAEIEGQQGIERAFQPLVVHGIMLEFDPKQDGSPICVLTGERGNTKEIRPLRSKARAGHFRHQIQGDEAWSSIRVSTFRGKKARLLKIKLVGKPV